MAGKNPEMVKAYAKLIVRVQWAMQELEKTMVNLWNVIDDEKARAEIVEFERRRRADLLELMNRQFVQPLVEQIAPE